MLGEQFSLTYVKSHYRDVVLEGREGYLSGMLTFIGFNQSSCLFTSFPLFLSH